jgi:hypothetical protein
VVSVTDPYGRILDFLDRMYRPRGCSLLGDCTPARTAWLYLTALLMAAEWGFPQHLRDISSAQLSSASHYHLELVVWYQPVIWPLAALQLSRRRIQWLLCVATIQISPHKIFRVGHKRNNYLWRIKHYEAHIVYEHVSQAFNYRQRHNFMSDDRKSSLWP